MSSLSSDQVEHIKNISQNQNWPKAELIETGLVESRTGRKQNWSKAKLAENRTDRKGTHLPLGYLYSQLVWYTDLTNFNLIKIMCMTT